MDAPRTPNRGDLVRNALWLIFEQGVARVVGLFVGVWVARYLGPTDFGAMAFAATFISLFFWTSQLGVEAVAVKELVRNPGDEGIILGSAMRLQLTGAAIGAGIACGIAVIAWGIESRTTTLIAISALMMALPLSGAFAYRFKARVAERPAILARNIGVLVGAAAKVAAITAGAGVFWFAGANALTCVICLVLVGYAYHRHGGRIADWRYDATRARELFHQSWPLALSAVAVGLNMQIDQVMVRVLDGERAVGIYAAAVRVSEAAYVLPVAVCASAYPILVRLHDELPERYTERLQALMDWLTWLAIPGAIVAGLLSPWIVALLFGADYAETAPVLALHIWSAAFVAQGMVQGQWFVIEQQQRIQSLIHVVAAGLNVALNFWLVPLHGPAGAAMATLVTYGFVVVAPLASRATRPTAWSALAAYAYPLRLLFRRRPTSE